MTDSDAHAHADTGTDKDCAGRSDRPARPPRAWYRLLSVLIVVIVAALAVFKITCYDVWFHLSYGREVLGEMAIPRIEPFTWLAAGQPKINPSWLFGVLVYALHSAGSFAALILFKALVLAAAFFVVFRDGSARRDAATVALVVTAAAALVSRGRFYVRPEMFLLLFSPLYVLLLDRFARDGRRGVLLIPLLQLAWANLHGSAIVGAALVGAWLVGGVVVAAVGRRVEQRTGQPVVGGLSRSSALQLSAILVATLAASLVTPWGLQPYRDALALIAPYFAEQGVSEAAQKAEILKHRITELMPLWQNDAWRGPIGAFFGLCAITLGGWLVLRLVPRIVGTSRRGTIWRAVAPLVHINVVRIGVAAGVVALAFGARRFLALAAVLLAPLVARAGADLLRSDAEKLHPKVRALIAVGAALAVIGTAATEVARERFQVGLSVNPATYPERAVDYLADNAVAGPLYNMPAWGGYITWHGRRRVQPAVDGRFDVPADVLEIASAAWGDMRRLLELERRYHPQVLLLRFRRLTESQIAALGGGTAQYDLLLPDWVVVYWDDIAVVVVRRDGPNTALAERDGLRHVRPVEDFYVWDSPRLADDATRQAIADDALRARDRTRENLRASLVLAKTQLRAGAPRRSLRLANEVLQRAAPRRSSDTEDIRLVAHATRAAAAERLGRRAVAVESYRFVADTETYLAPWGAGRAAMLLETAGDHDRAVAYYQRSVAHPSSAEAEVARRLVGLLRQRGDQAGLQEAQRALRAIEQQGEGKQLFEQGTRLYLQRQLDRARALLSRSVTINPRNAAALSNLGFVLYDLGQYDAAAARQRAALAVDPDFANAHYGLGLAYVALRDRQRAIDHLRRFLSLKPRGEFARKTQSLLRRLNAR